MNFNKYINLPFKDLGRSFDGVDCYGLVALIYEQELDIIIPDYTDLIWDKDRFDISKKEEHLLNQIGLKWVKVEGEPKVFDMLIFNDDNSYAQHVGLYIGGSKFIHSSEKTKSRVDYLNRWPWKNKFYGMLRFNMEG